MLIGQLNGYAYVDPSRSPSQEAVASLHAMFAANEANAAVRQARAQAGNKASCGIRTTVAHVTTKTTPQEGVPRAQ